MYIKHSLRSRRLKGGWGIARKENASGHAGYIKHTIMPVLFCEVAYSAWNDHVLGWWKHKDDPNVLFLKYEDLHKVMFSYNNNSITLSSVASLISYTPARD